MSPLRTKIAVGIWRLPTMTLGIMDVFNTVTRCLRVSSVMITAGLILAVIVVRIYIAGRQRDHKRQERHARYHKAFPTTESLMNMTNNDAFPIIRDLQQIDFPFSFETSLAAALIRPFGLPTVSAVLAKTKQFANVDDASKRTADTACLVIDMSQYPPESDRACAALSRTNYLHHQYQKAGLIKNDDLLHTLALLSWLPVRFVETWEWRALEEAEVYAVGVYWKSIGDAMGISYDSMEAYATLGPAKDGKEFMEKLSAWSEQYELDHMHAHPVNAKAVQDTEVVLLYGMTGIYRALGRRVLSAVMDDRLRSALM